MSTETTQNACPRNGECDTTNCECKDAKNIPTRQEILHHYDGEIELQKRRTELAVLQRDFMAAELDKVHIRLAMAEIHAGSQQAQKDATAEAASEKEVD